MQLLSEFFSDPDKLVKNPANFAEDADGNEVRSTSDKAVRYCLIGARRMLGEKYDESSIKTSDTISELVGRLRVKDLDCLSLLEKPHAEIIKTLEEIGV